MADENVLDMESLRRFRPKAPAPWMVRAVVLGVLALILLATSWFTVSPEEVGIVVQFGRYVRTAEPGLNFKIPFGVESVRKVPVQRQLKEEFGFRTEAAGIRTRYAPGTFEDESLMLTGDLNAAVVEWIVQYRVRDPYKFLFKVRDPLKTLRDMSEATMRSIVGDRTVNEVLTIGRQEVAATMAIELQELCNQYENGLDIEQVVLQDVNPPGPVKPSFNEVNQAQAEREKLINEALAEYNQVIPRARGEARQTISQAEGYALDRVNRAEGEATKFNSVYDAYRKAPDVTRQRIYLETMNDILPRAGRKIIVDASVKGILPLLQLDSKGGDR